MGYSFALTVALFSAKDSNAQGAASALSFTGTSHVNMGDSLSKAIANSDFTIEMWIKIRSNASDPVFIGNKNWANGANTGFVWCRYAANTIRFNFRASTRTRKDYNMTLDYAKWNHIAITVKRNGTITGYVNGRQNGTPINIAADSGYTLDAALPFRIGADGNAAYPINGDMDEVRIWNTVRTEADIRNSMCQKIAGTASNLIAYYRMDETSGTVVTNGAAVSSGYFDGAFVNTPLRVASGAAIGDTAVHLYASTFAGQNISLGSAANGNVVLQNISDAMSGIQVYKVNAAPNTTTGIPNPGTNNVYYGVFPVNDTAAYDVTYEYGNYPDAVTYEGGIDLFRRNSVDSVWALWGAVKNTANNTLALTAAKKRSEMVLGSFVTSITCNTPDSLNVQNISTGSAMLNWVTGGSNLWNISYGTGTFTPGTGGTTIHNVNTNPYLLSGLQSNTTYSFYVQDTCAPINSSGAWAGPYTFTTAIDYSTYGSGYGLNFQGTAANEHVNLGDSLSAALGLTNFTLETWIRFNNPSSDPAFIGNKNWDNGQNTGILWCWNGNNNLRFNFKPVGGTRRDYDINVPNPSKWNHIAMVVDRSGNLTAYLNGVQTGNPISIIADTGKTLDGVLPLRIGQDGTGTYGPKFKGAMDELKIWDKVLTAEEIRTNMCQKLEGTETNLLAYYRMDESSGNALLNAAANTAGVFNGTLLNNPQRIISGAAIGDTSIYVYPADWNNIGLTLSSNAQGSLAVDSVASTAKGVHIYRINNVPNFTSGISEVGTTNQFFGVFTAGNLSAAYRMQYDYSNYPNAVTNDAALHLYNRTDNAATSWIQSAAQNNTTTHVISLSQQPGVRQFILADFSPAACPTPVNVAISNVDTGNATLHWSSSAAGHIVEIGSQNFSLGSGTQYTTADTFLVLNSLNASAAYDFYIKDSCSATSSSAWVGPFSFSTLNPCPQPFNITADSITTSSIIVKWEDNGIVTQDYLVSWGAQGFGNPAFGIQDNVTGKRFELAGATTNTAYDFYIRANCNSSVSNSGWTGPYTFSTISCDVPASIAAVEITENTAKITWSSLAAQHKLEYGPSGFATGSGTVIAGITVANQQLAGLTAATAYDVYVQDSCSEAQGSSVWAGPVSFTTSSVTSLNDRNNNEVDFKVYPNPSKDKVWVSLPAGIAQVTINVKNTIGVSVYQAVTKQQQTAINTAGFPSGLYFVEVSQGNNRSNKKIVIQH